MTEDQREPVGLRNVSSARSSTPPSSRRASSSSRGSRGRRGGRASRGRRPRGRRPVGGAAAGRGPHWWRCGGPTSRRWTAPRTTGFAGRSSAGRPGRLLPHPRGWSGSGSRCGRCASRTLRRARRPLPGRLGGARRSGARLHREVGDGPRSSTSSDSNRSNTCASREVEERSSEPGAAPSRSVPKGNRTFRPGTARRPIARAERSRFAPRFAKLAAWHRS